jgi:hypothetical protein
MKETKEMLHFMFGIANAVGKSLADGVPGVTDAMYFLTPITSASAAFADAKLIPSEWSKKTPEDQAELLEYCKTELDLPEEGLETLIEEGMEIGFKFLGFVGKIAK